MGTIGEDMRKVLTSMLDPAIITINDNQGFTNPLNSLRLKTEDPIMRFELGVYQLQSTLIMQKHLNKWLMN